MKKQYRLVRKYFNNTRWFQIEMRYVLFGFVKLGWTDDWDGPFGHRDCPIENFDEAVDVLKELRNNRKVIKKVINI